MLYQARQCHASHVVVDDINLFSCLTMYIIVDDSFQLTVSSKIAGSCFASLRECGCFSVINHLLHTALKVHGFFFGGGGEGGRGGGGKDYKISNKDNKYIYLKKCPSSEAVHSDV